MANISERNGGVLCPRASSDTSAEPQCEPGDILLAGVKPEDDLHGGGGRTDACKKMGWPEELGCMVDRGCHSFLSKRLGTVLKATEDQMISHRCEGFPERESAPKH